METRSKKNLVLATALVFLSAAILPASLAQANSVSGGANGGSVSSTVRILGVTTPLNLPSIAPVTLPPSGGSSTNQVPGVNRGVPAVTVTQTDTIVNSTSGSVSGTSATAESSSTVTGLNILNGLVTADEVISKSKSDANGVLATSTAAGSAFVNLDVSGSPINEQPAPNTVIPISNVDIGLLSVSGTVTLNEQIQSGNGVTTSSLTVNQIHVNVTGSILGGLTSISADVVIASASSGVSFVAAPNGCPTVLVSGGTTRAVQVGQTLTFGVSATDPDGDAVTLQASNIPANASFSPNPATGTPTASGTFSFTPQASQANQTFIVSFTASDDNGCSGSVPAPVAVQITVTPPPPVNNCPSITVNGGTTRSVQVGQTLTFSVSATDPDGDAVTLQAANIPANGSFSPNPATGTPTASGTFSFTPQASQANQTFIVSFTASDDNGCSGSVPAPVAVQITVTPPPPGNNCPIVTVTGGTTRSVQVGQTLTFSVSATDPDGDAVTLQASNIPANASFSPNPATGTPTASGTFSFTPQASQANQTFIVSFTASDDNGCSGSVPAPVAVQITVTPPPPGNNCPIMTVTGGTTRSVQVGQTLTFSVSATDPDGDTVTLQAANVPANASFSPNPATGTPTASGTFSFTPQASQANQTLSVTFTASDNDGCSGSVPSPITVLITVTPPPPPGNNCPVVTVSGDITRSVRVGQALVFTVSATDPDGDLVTLVATSIPAGASFSPNPAIGSPTAAGVFSFTPVVSQGGQTFTVTFSATDDRGCTATVAGATQVVTITVQPGGAEDVSSPCGNHAPLISVPPIPAVGLGQTLEFIVKATDEEGDSVSLSAETLPENATFDPATEKFSFKPEADQLRRAQLGQGLVAVFLARDSRGAASRAIVDITPVVSIDGPMPPILSVPPGPIVVRVIDKLSFAVAGLAQSPNCSVSIISETGDASISSQDNRTFSMAPNALMVDRTFVVTFTATDCAGRTRRASVRIIVIDADSDCTPLSAGRLDVPNNKLFFERTRVNDHSGGSSFSVTNKGGGLLSINSVSMSDEVNYRLEGVPAAPLVLQPGGTLELRVFFEPKSKGTKQGTVTILSSDPDRPLYEVVVRGKAVN